MLRVTFFKYRGFDVVGIHYKAYVGGPTYKAKKDGVTVLTAASAASIRQKIERLEK